MLLSTQNIHMDYLGLCPGVLCQHCWGAVGDRRKSHFSVLQTINNDINREYTDDSKSPHRCHLFLIFTLLSWATEEPKQS